MRTWASRLLYSLKQAKMSQKDLASMIGVSAAAVSKWTAGKEIHYHHLRAVADALGVNWIWLRHGQAAMDSSFPTEEQELIIGGYAANLAALDAGKREHWHSMMAHAMGWGVWTLDLDKNLLWYSDALRRMYGVPRSAKITRGTFRSLLLPEDAENATNYVTEIVVKKKPFAIQTFRLKKNPSRWFCMVATPISDEDGHVRFIGGVVFVAVSKAILEAMQELADYDNQPPVD